MPVRIGELLLKEKRISPAQLQDALSYQKTAGGKLGYNLVKLGFVKDEEITSLLSKQYGVPSINLAQFDIDPAIVKLIPAETAHKYQIIPLSRAAATLTIAMTDPTNVFAMDDIKFMTGYNVEPVVASETAVADAIARYYPSNAPAAPRIATEPKKKKEPKVEQAANLNNAATLEMVTRALEETAGVIDEEDVEMLEEIEQIDVSTLEKQGGEAPVIRLVNLMLMSAIQKGASDIHVEPYEKEFRVRFRIDGILHNIMALPMRTRDPLISRLKIMAKLDISEKRLPQDGRIKIRLRVEERTRDLDLRVSVVPTQFGEKVVMRLLDKSRLQLDMTQLGFDQEPLRRFKDAIDRPYGIVMVTGPTGSGKTNTLYSAIAQLNDPTVNILTAEDPIEFNLAGINQVQMKEQIGLTFASAMRSFLRQDPDIILVGEIRDFETAEIAVKAALTGHLVLSTLHTNDAPSTVNRLMNMGIEPFLVATAVNCIAAQRLVRKVCTGCSEDVDTSPQTLIQIGFAPDEVKTLKVKRGRGCESCKHTGYKGRLGLFEVLSFTDEIRDMILTGASSIELKRRAVEEGMVTLRVAGLHKIRDGVTTLEEVLRETVA